jgi:hypothetical protein
VTMTGPAAVPAVAQLGNRTRFELAQTIASDAVVASSEVHSLRGIFGRARLGVLPLDPGDGRLSISDLALLAVGQGSTSIADAPTLGAVIPEMLVAPRVPHGAGIALYWELYGLRTGDRADFTLSAHRVDQSALGRMVERVFGHASDPIPLRITFQDGPAAGLAIEGRRVNVDLSALQPGRYRLTLTAKLPGDAPVSADRDIEITR